tara:strand:- start:5629 stop:6465 length:837 start_codon:yes stop_codon:yes gene_type:complete
MQSSPMISVVIPVFNAEKYIIKTLLSLKEQTFSDYEVVVIDNASTDNSLELIKSFSHNFKKISIIEVKVNSGGPANPRNLGIDKAEGKYISFLDSDDIWEPNKLKDQVIQLENENINFVSSAVSYIDSNDEHIKKKWYVKLRLNNFGFITLNSLIKNNNIHTSTVVLSRDIIGTTRFDESKEVTAVEDYLFWLDIANKENAKMFNSSNVTTKYRVFSASLSASGGKCLSIVKLFNSKFKFIINSKRTDLFTSTLIWMFVDIASFYFIKFVSKLKYKNN